MAAYRQQNSGCSKENMCMHVMPHEGSRVERVKLICCSVHCVPDAISSLVDSREICWVTEDKEKRLVMFN